MTVPGERYPAVLYVTSAPSMICVGDEVAPVTSVNEAPLPTVSTSAVIEQFVTVNVVGVCAIACARIGQKAPPEWCWYGWTRQK